MRKSLTSVVALLLGLAPLSAPAHEGHDHGPVTGTVAKVEGARMELKSPDGKPVTVALTAATAYVKGKDPATKADLKPGVRVAVETISTKTGLEAKVVKIGAPEEPAVWTCPMHPEVRSDGPGKCPKCGMFLEKKKA